VLFKINNLISLINSHKGSWKLTILNYNLLCLADPEISIDEDPLPEGIKSTLTIRVAQSAHFGAYNCTAKNGFGSDIAEINLRVQGNLGYIYFFLIKLILIYCNYVKMGLKT